MISYASFDPGKTTGVATWDINGNCLGKTKLNEESLIMYFKALSTVSVMPLVFIYEKFAIRPGKEKAFIGSSMETVQAIGMIKLFAKLHGIKLIPQHENIRKVAALWSGTTVNWRVHMPDEISAYLHGYYYLHECGIIGHRVLDEWK